MHIEPGLVDGTKIILSYATGAAALAYAAQQSRPQIKRDGAAAFLARSAVTTTIVLGLFQLLPHPPVGLSEVHLILGSTLFLLFGVGPAAIGLAFGLLIQGVAFEPVDVPQYGMNVTTLLVPLFALQAVARRVVPPGTAYVDLTYRQVFLMSASFQIGIVSWVAFWAFYGEGAAAVSGILPFGAAYTIVLLLEPVIDLMVLRTAKTISVDIGSRNLPLFFERRLLKA
jgi:ABC-type Co2+ transport system permease subunit